MQSELDQDMLGRPCGIALARLVSHSRDLEIIQPRLSTP